jgi:hypothetical protein
LVPRQFYSVFFDLSLYTHFLMGREHWRQIEFPQVTSLSRIYDTLVGSIAVHAGHSLNPCPGTI